MRLHEPPEAPTAVSAPRADDLSTDWIIYVAIIGDTLALSAAWCLSFFERGHVTLGFLPKNFDLSEYSRGVFVGTVIYLLILKWMGAYDKRRLIQRRLQILELAVKASLIWASFFLVTTIIFELQTTISRLFVFWAVLNSFFAIFFFRAMFRRFLFTSKLAARLKDRVLVVGWSKESDALAKQIAHDPGHVYEVIGCTPSAHGKFWVKPPAQVPVLGDYNGMRELLLTHRPNTVLLADLDPVMGELIALAELCVKENVRFRVIPSFFQIFVSGLHLESISGIPVIGISKLPLDHMHNRLIKRVIDIVGATVGLVLSAPLIVIFGIMIYRESPGPIFYTQVRSGRAGQVFKIYKLRSMKLNAEMKGPQWTTENDPRRLKIGEFMRKTNIDEIPQFWNVLKGEMSLVGPRPERPELIENFKEGIPHYNARHYSKPGVSGYAQINGLRGNTDLRERIRFDIYYLENWSIWLDFNIMIRTFFVRTNAY